jgi:hypothetical protein
MKMAYAQSRNAMINEFTNPDGKPKSVTSRNALVSIGVTFDKDGRAVKATPENVLMSALPTPVNPPAASPAAPAASTRGGPMAPQPKPASPAAAMPAPKTQAEYDAIPKGTKYIDTDGKEKIKG